MDGINVTDGVGKLLTSKAVMGELQLKCSELPSHQLNDCWRALSDASIYSGSASIRSITPTAHEEASLAISAGLNNLHGADVILSALLVPLSEASLRTPWHVPVEHVTEIFSEVGILNSSSSL